MTKESSTAVIKLLSALPTGIIKMSDELPGQVETSLNLGITMLENDRLALSFYLRSSKEQAIHELSDRLFNIASGCGANAEICSSYPAWEYRKESALRDRMVSLYREKYGKEPIVNTIHAGLECGIIAAKVDGLDCISIGPDNYCLHTTEEHLSISSFVSVWDFILEFLKQKDR